jgi:hypothetical protein
VALTSTPSTVLPGCLLSDLDAVDRAARCEFFFCMLFQMMHMF